MDATLDLRAGAVPSASGSRQPMRLLMGSVVLSGLACVATEPFMTVAVLHRLGADDRVVAVLNCITSSAVLVAVPAAWWLRRASPRLATVGLVAAMRLGVLLVLAAWLARDLVGHAAVWLVCAALAAEAVCGSAASGPHDTWMRAVVPQRLIGGFLGRRVALSTVIAGASCPLAGAALERWGDAAIAPVLLWGVVLNAVELPLLLRVGDGRRPVEAVEAGPTLADRWRDPAFRRPMIAQMPLLAATALSAPWLLVALYDLGCSAMAVAVVVTAQTLSAATGLAVGGRWADRGDQLGLLARLGRWRVATIAGLAGAVALVAGHHPLALPALVLAAGIDAALAGASASAAMRLSFRLVADGAPGGFAAIGLLRGLAGVAGTLVGTALGSAVIAHREAISAAMPWCHYLVAVLAVSALATWLATAWMRRLAR